jgi:hypothetical protein
VQSHRILCNCTSIRADTRILARFWFVLLILWIYKEPQLKILDIVSVGLPGLWVGQVVGLFIVGLGEYVIVWRFTDWDEEVKRGIARVST